MDNRTPEDPAELVKHVQMALHEYAGYARPEERRLSDESLRALLASTLQVLVSHLDSLQAYLATHHSGLRPNVERIGCEVERLLDKVQSAPYALAPFFTVSRLPDQTLLRILTDDLEILDAHNRIREILRPTLDDTTDFVFLADALENVVRCLSERLESRSSTILEFLA